MPRRIRRALRWSIAAAIVLVGLAALRATLDSRPACGETPEPGSVDSPDSAFAVFGDFGGGEDQGAVASAVRTWTEDDRPIDAIVTTGDNVYPCGHPDDFEEQLRAPYEQIGAPMWVTLGNRDVVGGFGDEQLTFLGLPDLPYAKELPGVQLLFLDSNSVDDAQTEWLDRTLSSPGPPLRVVLFHHPAYSCGYNGSTPDVIEHWVPILERHRVAAVFSGHDHYYERFRSEGDIHYVVTGGGGMYLLDIGDECPSGPERIRAESTHHFVYVEVLGTRLKATAVDREGQIVDTFEAVR